MVVPEGPIDLAAEEETPEEASPTIETSFRSKDDENIMVEYSNVRIPYERAVSSFRSTQKETDLEATLISKFLSTPTKMSAENKQDAQTKLDKLVAKVQNLQKKIKSKTDVEVGYLNRCKTRMRQLEESAQESVTSIDGFLKGGPRRDQRIIAEYLASRGYILTAKKYLKAGVVEADSGSDATSSTTPLDDIDFDIYEECRDISTALRSHNLEPASLWAQTHRSKLRRAGSTCGKMFFTLT